MGCQPDQALDCEDDAGEDEGPLLAPDVCVVPLLREVDGQEGRPDDRKGPDIGVQEEGPRSEKLGRLDLRVLDEPRWRRRHCRWSRATARCQNRMGQRIEQTGATVSYP